MGPALFRADRLFSHQKRPPIRTAAARIPNAIQPHGVSSAGSCDEATAAPAAAAAAVLEIVVVTVVAGRVAVVAGSVSVAGQSLGRGNGDGSGRKSFGHGRESLGHRDRRVHRRLARLDGRRRLRLGSGRRRRGRRRAGESNQGGKRWMAPTAATGRRDRNDHAHKASSGIASPDEKSSRRHARKHPSLVPARRRPLGVMPLPIGALPRTN